MLWVLAVALLSFLAGGKTEPQYVLSIPAVIKSNESATACVDFVRLNESLDVSSQLEYFEQKIRIFNERIPETDKFLKCVTFQVPVAKSAVPVFITLTANGLTTKFSERRSVVIDPVGAIMKIQTDKQIYKPGDVVRCRLISLNEKLRPVSVKVASIYLLDPSSNRMFQLLDQVSDHGVVSFEFPLLSNAAQGTYRIEAQTESAETISKSFSVDEYVLPRFVITLDAPSAATLQDEVLPYNISAKYTYGLGVPGTVTSRLCRRYSSYYPGNTCNRSPDGICQTSTGQMDSDGSYGGIFDLSQFQLNRPGLDMVFHLQVTISEEGTAVQATESRHIYISSEILRVTFDRQVMKRDYKPGMPFYVRLRVFNPAGQPQGNVTVELVAGTNTQNLTTADDGSAECYLDTSAFLESEISIQAVFKRTEQCYDSNWLTPTISNDYFTIRRSYSRTLSYMQAQAPSEELPCGKTHDIKVQYALSEEGVGEGNAVSLTYMVLSKASIVQHGHKELNLSSSLNGEVSFSVVGSPDLAPVCDIVVYIILNEETIADAARMKIEKCFKHQVSMTFSAEEAIPGSTVDLVVSAAPSSLCGLLVTDSSMLLLDEKQDITADSIYNDLRYTTLSGYNVAGFNVAPLGPPCVDPKKTLFVNGFYYEAVSYSNEGDAYQVFHDVGLMVATNSTLHKPEVCGRSGIFSTPGFTNFGRPAPSFAREEAFSGGSSVASPVITVRNQFPDVWVFSLESLGDNGTTSIPTTVPGTITQWQFNGFCVTDKEGFGITKRASNLKAFLPFFVESSMPYSIVRKEVMVLSAFVQNSLKKCTKIDIKLDPSEDFTAEMMQGQQEICICHGERASYSWNLIFKKTGVIPVNVTAWTNFIGDTCDSAASDPSQPFRMDSMIGKVIVEAEGIENEITFSSLVNLNGANVQIPITINPPSNMVEGSLQSSVVVIGEVLGLSAANLGSLIRLPTGCGEQILAALMPIPHILKYLNVTGQMTDDLKAKAISYMSIGYQKQLIYVNPDGSSNVFGRPYSGDSTWLTAMRFAALESIKPYVYFDESLQNRALLIIERSQDRDSGCFNATGVYFNDDLRGTADGHIGFTAYVTIAMLQSSYPGGITLLRGALQCMDAASKTNQSTFNVAILALALRLAAGYEAQANEMIRQLKERAVEEDGTIHWQRENKPKPKDVPFFYPPEPSSEMEMTSYALLAMTHGANPSQAEMSYMASVARWIARQMNSHGGGRSTADTVVALQALSAYGCLVPAGNTTQQVTLSSGNEVLRIFNIDQSNRLLLQTQTLANNLTQFNIDVTGTGSCFIQTRSKYNMPVSEENAAFALSVNTSSESCANGVAHTYTISIATSFHGSQNSSNMTVMDIKITSGYKPNELSLRKLRDKVSKVEVEGNHVLVYLLSVSRDPIHISFDVEMQGQVLNSQPQTVFIYNYYELSLYGRAVLYHPCAA